MGKKTLRGGKNFKTSHRNQPKTWQKQSDTEATDAISSLHLRDESDSDGSTLSFNSTLCIQSGSIANVSIRLCISLYRGSIGNLKQHIRNIFIIYSAYRWLLSC